MSTTKARSMILAIGAVAITAAGAYTGANYKTESEKQSVRQDFISETTERKLARLEAQKAVWVAKRTELLRKMEQLDAKIAGKKAGGEGGEKDDARPA